MRKVLEPLIPVTIIGCTKPSKSAFESPYREFARCYGLETLQATVGDTVYTALHAWTGTAYLQGFIAVLLFRELYRLRCE